jgi:hypothetical protein
LESPTDQSYLLLHHSDQWSKIALCLPGRTDAQVMMRYRKMHNWEELANMEETLFQKTGVRFFSSDIMKSNVDMPGSDL